MATHSSILAWRIPWTEKPGGLQSMEWQIVGHNSSNLACTHVAGANWRDGRESEWVRTLLFGVTILLPLHLQEKKDHEAHVLGVEED